MGLFSFLNKNKQDATPGKSEYRSQSDEPFTNARTRAKRTNSKDTGPDPILPEKKRARRRLIGAVVLVLAVVIVLPMILDPEPKPLNDDISVQIPSRDNKTSAAAGKQLDAASLGATEELVDNRPLEKPVDTPPVKAAAAPSAAPVVTPAAPAMVAPVEKPIERQVEKPVAKTVEKPAEKPVAAAPKIEKPTPPPAEAKHVAPAAAKPTEEQRALAILQGKPVPDEKTD